LYIKDVLDLGIIGFRPDVSPRRRLGQFGVDAKAIASATNAAYKQIANVELAPDFGGREGLVL
jgi:hypothetical protein